MRVILLSFCIAIVGVHGTFETYQVFNSNEDFYGNEHASEEDTAEIEDFDEIHRDFVELKKTVETPTYKNINTVFYSPELVVKMNTAIDIVLDGYRWIYAKNNDITVKLPKIDKYFGKGVYRGKFIAENGYFTNLATLHRTGDVNFFKIGSSVGINASMGLTLAEAGYKNYSLDILEIKQNGSIKVDVGHTSLSLSITLTYSPKCAFTLDYVHFDELSQINTNITGLGAFQLLFEQLSTWLIGNFEPSLKTLVNEKLYTELNKVLKDKDICQYVPTF